MTARASGSSARKMPAVLFGSRTDVGCVRDHNEDSLIVAPPLFAVADGMGGHAAGEVASEIAVNTLARTAPDRPDTEGLCHAVIASNRAVIEAATEKGREGMGCTLTAAILESERLAIAQVGDSRAYLLHQGRMQQLTRDHSLMEEMIEAGELTPEEARVHPQRSVITRALGSDPNMQPDLYELNVSAGDRLILCSDGLSTMLEDPEIESIAKKTRDPQRCASVLVNEAIAAGGYDNVTVIVLDVAGNAAKRERKTRRKGRIWAVVLVIALLSAVAGVCYAGYAYSQHTAYLADVDGKVAVYQGTPDTVLGLPLSHLDRITDINVSDLEPGTANRLQQGTIRVDDMDAANDLVDTYQQNIDSSKKTTTSSSASGNTTNGSTTSGNTSSSNTNSGTTTTTTAVSTGASA